MVKKIVTLCALVILVSGCYELGGIQTSEQSGVFYFSISKDDLASKDAEAFILSDMSVAKEDCEKDCVIWTIIRQTNDEQSIAQNINTSPIKYGGVPKGMKVTVAPVDLSPGHYTVAATVGYVNQAKIVGGGLVHGRFELIQNQNNSGLILKK
jgi:hypothetical protein